MSTPIITSWTCLVGFYFTSLGIIVFLFGSVRPQRADTFLL